MRNLALIVVAGLSLAVFALCANAADEGSWTGVLIDNHCGDKQADEAAAGKHPVACNMKDACSASGFQLMVGDKHVKLDDKGNEAAKKYLADAKSAKVTVAGKMDGDKIAVTSIKAAEEKP